MSEQSISLSSSWVWKLIPVIILIVLVMISYNVVMSSPLGRGLSTLFGGVGGVLQTIGAQLTTCKDGFFKKGCWLGWLGLGMSVLLGIYWVLNKLGITGKISDRLKRSLERGSAISGKSINSEIELVAKRIDFRDLYSEEMLEKYPDIIDYIAERVAMRVSNELNKARLKTSSNSKDLIREENIKYKEDIQSSRDEIIDNNDITEEELKEFDGVADGIDVKPFE